MTLAEAATPPARLASWKFRFLGVSVSGDSVHVEFVPCHSAGTLPSLHALTRCVLFGQEMSSGALRCLQLFLRCISYVDYHGDFGRRFDRVFFDVYYI